MAQLSEANVCLRWLEECGRIDPIYPTSEGREATWGPRRRGDWRMRSQHSSWSISVNLDGRLVHTDRNSVTELARFVGERRLMAERGGAVLLNGNGFRGGLTQIQTRLRERAQRLFAISRVMIIPYAALTGAEIEFDSILPIHVSADTWENRRIYLKEVPPSRMATEDDRRRGSSTHMDIGERRFRYVFRSLREPLLRQVLSNNGYEAFNSQGGQHWLVERVHNLGSTVFSAVGPDGERHRYISSFDPQEDRMYFLAQLPDEGECNNYIDAIDLLAPPIVHQARSEGRHVFRQGDIFAIQTDLTDKDMIADAKITRRDSVFHNNSTTLIKPEIRKSATAKRLRIYGTGHTATIVATKPNGITFIKGVMYHDPVLERANRTREHRSITLTADKWFLVCRNTVPRATAKVTPKNTTERGAT